MPAAPLLDLPQAPVPAGGTAAWVEAADGARLRAALFPALAVARGSVVLSPGRTEPIEKYFEVVGELRARGFAVLVHDWRGQGLSPRWLADREKGHAHGWRRYLADFRTLLQAYERDLPRPWITLSHSMGGGLTTLALAEGETRFAGAVLSAPMLGLRLAGRSPWLVRWVAWLMTLIGRGDTYVYSPQRRQAEAARAGSVLTHDRARWDRFQAQLAADPALKLGGFTWGWLSFACALTFRLAQMRWVERIAIPMVLVGAEYDRLCTNAAQIAVAERTPHGRYVKVKGAFHEIMMETDALRAVFWDAFDTLADEVAPQG